MTAHILYEKLDPDKCVTQSKIIIHSIIRKYIKFRGILMSDDICMKALSGGIVKNAKLSLDAGCNLGFLRIILNVDQPQVDYSNL